MCIGSHLSGEEGSLSLSLAASLSLSGANNTLRLMDLAPFQAQMETLETNIFHLLVRGLLLEGF